MIKPEVLNPGACIGIIAPSGPVTPQEIDPAITYLKKSGFNVKTGASIYRKKGYLAGEDMERLNDLHSMFMDEEVSAIFCARGGYGALRLLRLIDFELISRRPKIFLGYSDITALLNAFLIKAGLVTFHGPVLKDFFKSEGSNIPPLMDLLRDGKPPAIDLDPDMIISEGKARGILMGGNLSTFNTLIGTPYIRPLKDVILFLEDKGEAPYRVDRMLHQLIISDFFRCVRAILFGEFIDCGDVDEINSIISNIAEIIKIPVLKGLPFGHGARNIPFPVGVKVELDTSKGIYFKEPCLNFHS